MNSVSESAPPGGDYNKGPSFTTLVWIENTVAFLFVSLRLYARAKYVKKFWWDDWFIIVTMILMIISSSIWTVYSVEGGARHVFYLTFAQANRAKRLNWISQPFTIMALGTGKASVAFFLLRILGPSKWRKPFLYFVAISSVSLCGIDSIISIVQCNPVPRLWNPNIKGNCWNPDVQAYFALFLAAYLALMDFILAFLPLTILWALQLNKKKKFGIASIMGLGVFAGACAIIKATKLPSLTGRSDLTWLTVSLLIWNNTELFAIVVAASVPAIRPLFLDLSRRVISIGETFSRSRHKKQRSTSYRLSTLPRSAEDAEKGLSQGSTSQEAMLAASCTDEIHPYGRKQSHDLIIRQTREWTVEVSGCNKQPEEVQLDAVDVAHKNSLAGVEV